MDCSCLAQTESESWLKPKLQSRGKQCYTKPQVYLAHDQYFRFWMVDRYGKKHEVVWLDFTEQYAWVDDHGTAHIWPSACEVPRFSGYGREAIAYYEPSRTDFWDVPTSEEAIERGFRPRGSVRITQESPRHKAVLTWNVENLRAYCWTEGHIHYNGDRHETLLKEYPEHENVHLNYYQQPHGVNHYDKYADKDRHFGDISNLHADENGNAVMTRTDQYVTLYGNFAAYGRMADLHFPKSCAYPMGWNDELNTLGNLDPAHDPNHVTTIVPAAQNDILGRHPNDKRGISFGVIGRLDDKAEYPPFTEEERIERKIPKWNEIKV